MNTGTAAWYLLTSISIGVDVHLHNYGFAAFTAALMLACLANEIVTAIKGIR